ncbi:MAG: phosphate/phosphite/phosphonate ABC transporter substrate-binding protein [Chloroflexi bacterium]|nr:phosphate/phosphite/phosphonate ABC transporter substrate-binding protein [Chloroflexota bacterium]
MVRLGGVASTSHMTVFQGLEELFSARGIQMDWVLYSDYDAMIDAFVSGDIDLAWNGPLGYVKIKRLISRPCSVIAMRDVDINFMTHFITRHDSDISTVEDLKGKSFAFGRRSSEQAGLLPLHFLKELGINPKEDLSLATFYEERESQTRSDERDVVERVLSGEYDAGSVSQRALEVMAGEGLLHPGQVRIFWTSPGYSHCCFTAQGDMDQSLYREVEQAFLAVDYDHPLGKTVLDAEGCTSFVPGVTEGWEIIEQAAVAEGLV